MKDWREVQRESFSKVTAIAEFLGIPQELLIEKPRFPFLLPRRIAEKMAKGRIDDPLARQFLPLKDELIHAQGFVMDPVCDASFRKGDRLLHKYQGRVLMIPSGACAMHCRYCFRRNFDYPDKDDPISLEYIRNDSSIHEVILSGGDPLSLSDEKLNTLLQEIASIPHIQLIRFHTRFPIGIPERISNTFLEILKRVLKQIVFVVHINHLRELDTDIVTALKSVQALGIPVITQSVLLAGVNDDFVTLKELFLGLSSCGILPYYLHQLDQVRGASHYNVPTSQGLALIEALRAELPGYALPRYVQEIPHAPSKMIVI